MDISNPIKVILVGEKDTGKTSIINRLVSDSFEQASSPTIGKNTTNYTLNKITLNIWDTSGEEKFRTVNSLFYKGAKIVLFVYSIVDRKSFDELSKYWMNTIETSLSNPSKYFIYFLVMVVVGNKSDLFAEATVSEDEGRRFAKQHEAIFANTSCKTGEGKSQANLVFLLFDYIKPKDFLFYIFGNRSTKGEKMIALSVKMTLESLSCEQLIKNNINLYKVINSMDDKQVAVFTNVKPELIKQMENMNLIPNMNEKNKLSQKMDNVLYVIVLYLLNWLVLVL